MPSFPYRPSWSPENAALARHLLIQELDMVLASEHAERAAAMLPNGTLVEVLAGPLTQRLPGGAVQELRTHLAITSITGDRGYREI